MKRRIQSFVHSSRHREDRPPTPPPKDPPRVPRRPSTMYGGGSIGSEVSPTSVRRVEDLIPQPMAPRQELLMLNNHHNARRTHSRDSTGHYVYHQRMSSYERRASHAHDVVVRTKRSTMVDRTVLQAPPVLSERLFLPITEVRHREIHRDIHTYDNYRRVQPVYDVEVLPTRHLVLDENGNLVEQYEDDSGDRAEHDEHPRRYYPAWF